MFYEAFTLTATQMSGYTQYIEPIAFYPAFFQLLSLSMVALRSSSSMSAGCVVQLRGDWAIFCHAGSGRVGRMWSPREKSLEILHHGWEVNPGHWENRQWDTFILPLSYHDPGHGEDRQWDTFIFPLSYCIWFTLAEVHKSIQRTESISIHFAKDFS